jgi:hypothetical protein
MPTETSFNGKVSCASSLSVLTYFNKIEIIDFKSILLLAPQVRSILHLDPPTLRDFL